jgi:predicted negative regulator of RcsB-dependent stress response
MLTTDYFFHMDNQTLIVLAVIIVAAFYVGWSLWPARQQKSGCSVCPQNRNRVADYV